MHEEMRKGHTAQTNTTLAESDTSNITYVRDSLISFQCHNTNVHHKKPGAASRLVFEPLEKKARENPKNMWHCTNFGLGT